MQVTRHKINFDTGEVRERKRWVKRRKQFYTGGSGFLVINDGLAAAREIQQLVEWWCRVTGHQAAEFTMYDRLHDAHRARSET